MNDELLFSPSIKIPIALLENESEQKTLMKIRSSRSFLFLAARLLEEDLRLSPKKYFRFDSLFLLLLLYRFICLEVYVRLDHVFPLERLDQQ